MKPTATALVLSSIALLAAPARADELRDLVDRADMALRGDTSAGVFTMEIQTKSYKRSYKVVTWYDGRNDRERTLVKILGPALWRGFGTLKVGNQLKLYDPKTNHVTVVSSSMLGDSWMGSHFTNDDLVKETRLAEDYTLKLQKKWQGRSELGADSTFYRVALSPKPTAPVAWDRIVFTVVTRGDDALPTRADYFRKAKQTKPSRSMTFTDIRDLGGRRLPATMTITVANRPGEHTSLTYSKLKFDVKISASKFTEQALKK